MNPDDEQFDDMLREVRQATFPTVQQPNTGNSNFTFQMYANKTTPPRSRRKRSYVTSSKLHGLDFDGAEVNDEPWTAQGQNFPEHLLENLERWQLVDLAAAYQRGFVASIPREHRLDVNVPDIMRQLDSWRGKASAQPTEKRNHMLETLIKLYTTYMAQDVRSPTPHFAGPPGVGKSTVVAELANLLGVRMHVLNVARISPLEIEGVQMPVSNTDGVEHELKLRMLHSTLWTELKEGDIVLLDEFMRGFPEVYNGLLDIMTSRTVAGFALPKVFFVAASNSVAAYDEALEDRLLHIFVPDIRKKAGARNQAKMRVVDTLGLYPKVATSNEMSELFDNEVLPTYNVLDKFAHKPTVGNDSTKGSSVRKLIGQAQLRQVESNWLKDLIEMNNTMAMQDGKPQFVFIIDGKNPPRRYVEEAEKLKGNRKLSTIQATNLELNLQLIEMEQANATNQKENPDDDVFL